MGKLEVLQPVSPLKNYFYAKANLDIYKTNDYNATVNSQKIIKIFCKFLLRKVLIFA